MHITRVGTATGACNDVRAWPDRAATSPLALLVRAEIVSVWCSSISWRLAAQKVAEADGLREFIRVVGAS